MEPVSSGDQMLETNIGRGTDATSMKFEGPPSMVGIKASFIAGPPRLQSHHAERLALGIELPFAL
jgi:hypothetical protein